MQSASRHAFRHYRREAITNGNNDGPGAEADGTSDVEALASSLERSLSPNLRVCRTPHGASQETRRVPEGIGPLMRPVEASLRSSRHDEGGLGLALTPS